MEIGWSTSGGSRTVTVLDQYNAHQVENFQLDDGGSYAGFSLGNGSFALVNGLTGTSGNDIIAWSNASDVLSGAVGNDMLFGNDSLNGGAGSDLLVGGLGADTFKFNSGEIGAANLDKIVDFSEGDKIGISALLGASAVLRLMAPTSAATSTSR